MNYDFLLDESYNEGLSVKEKPFSTYDGRIKNRNIYLRRDMNTVEKSCVLAEELGHYYTTTGNILDQSNTEDRKQEMHARFWAYNKKIGLQGIVKAYEARLTNIGEIAEFLEVTPEFLREAIECYKSKYGIYTTLDNYIIFFEPSLSVAKILQD